MRISDITAAMIEYFGSDRRRINHLMKVYTAACTIAEQEGICGKEYEIIAAAALTHDIGIKVSEQKYNSSAGKYQETEGPPEARKLLESLGAEKEIIDRVCWLIAHHHTYKNIDSADYQILVEADFLVNLDEDKESTAAIAAARENIFTTKTGIRLLDVMFDRAAKL